MLLTPQFFLATLRRATGKNWQLVEQLDSPCRKPRPDKPNSCLEVIAGAMSNSSPAKTTDRQKLTVLVPCKNERLNIRPCIESFQSIADEILIADSGSEDGTLDIVADVGGCRVIEREYRTSGDFKNWAIPQANHEWILLVDADERVTPELADEIQTVLAQPEADGYWIFRNNHFMGYRVKHCGWNHDKVLRLFRRDMGRYEGPSDHGEVMISSGRVSKLRQPFLHYTYWSYDQLFRKFHRYTSLQAQQWYDQGKRPSLLRLMFNPPFRFFRDYVLMCGFLDGLVGFQISMIAAFYTFTKQARLWALHYAQPQPDPELERQKKAPTNDLAVDHRRVA